MGKDKWKQDQLWTKVMQPRLILHFPPSKNSEWIYNFTSLFLQSLAKAFLNKLFHFINQNGCNGSQFHSFCRSLLLVSSWTVMATGVVLSVQMASEKMKYTCIDLFLFSFFPFFSPEHCCSERKILFFSKLSWALHSFYITHSYTTGFWVYDETFPFEENCLLKLFPCLHLLGSAQLTPFRNLRRTSIAAPMEPISSEQSHPHFSNIFSVLVIASSAEPSQKTLTVNNIPLMN